MNSVFDHRRVSHGGNVPHTFYNFSIGIEFLPYKLTLPVKTLWPPVNSAFLRPCPPSCNCHSTVVLVMNCKVPVKIESGIKLIEMIISGSSIEDTHN